MRIISGRFKGTLVIQPKLRDHLKIQCENIFNILIHSKNINIDIKTHCS